MSAKSSRFQPALSPLHSAIRSALQSARSPAALATAGLIASHGAAAAPAGQLELSPGVVTLNQPATVNRALVLVDREVSDSADLLADLPPGATVVELPAAADPIAAIGQALALHPGIAQLHVLSHGEAGRLRLAGQTVDADLLRQRAGEIRGWFRDHSVRPEIMLYGCSAAAGDQGLALIRTLAELTGAVVSGSDDATGNPADGGDWVFERSTALAARAPIFGDAGRAEFQGLLATFTVSNTDDSGAGSLRQALLDANAAAGPDIVDATGVSGTITLTTGEIDITDEVAITGPGETSLTVSGNDDSRIFNISNGDVSLSGMTLTAGYYDGDGGAIHNTSGDALTITGVTISDSYAADDGGAIFQEYGQLTVIDSTITGNRADGDGGGIRFETNYSDDAIQITNSTISNNSADGDGGGVSIYAQDYAGTFQITGSTISGNTATGDGGGIHLYADSIDVDGGTSRGSLTVTDSTISGNSAGNGGGVWVYGEEDVPDVVITGSVIQNNSATSSGGYQYQPVRGGIGGYALGGGVFFANDYGSGGLTIRDTTISGNTAGGGGGVAVVFESYGSEVLIEDSIISGNSAAQSTPPPLRNHLQGTLGTGGGVLLVNEEDISDAPYGSLTIRNSTISGNSASNRGGGVAATAEITQAYYYYNRTSDNGKVEKADQRGDSAPYTAVSAITIENTTISGNSATETGGGFSIYAEASRGLDLINSTISGNQSANGVGGLSIEGTAYVTTYSYYRQGTRGTPVTNPGPGIQAQAEFVTIAANTGAIGGIGLVNDDDALTLANSIVADNTGSSSNDGGGSGTFDATFTLFEDAAGATLTGANNLTGSDPQLGALADNGCASLAGEPSGAACVQTHLPGPASPVINAGDPAFTPPPATDQRGIGRPQDNAVDMGAVEIAATPIVQLNTNDFDFGVVNIGVNGTGLIQITNTGSANLNVSGITDPGAPFSLNFNARGLSFCGAPPFTLVPSASCGIEAVFNPNAPGTFTATFDILSNAPSSPNSVTLRGSAGGPPVAVPALGVWTLSLLAGLMGLIGGVFGFRKRGQPAG